MNENYVFKSIHELAEHLIEKIEDITPIRLQKSLYFLFAYYGATYGKMNNESEKSGVVEGGNFPKYLFPEKFQAWKFGPVNEEVYYKFKDDAYSKKQWTPESFTDKEINQFLDDLLNQFNAVGDFSLVERSHQDKAWEEAFENGYNQEIDTRDLIEEYSAKYV